MWHRTFDTRLAAWNQLRTQSLDLSLEVALRQINAWWFESPWIPYHLHWDDRPDWPDPWQLITENYYCDLAKSLGMLYTLCLSKHGETLDAKICVYQNVETKYIYNLAVFDHGKYVINLLDDRVVNIESVNTELTLKHQISINELNLKN